MAIKIQGTTILDDSRNLVAANKIEANNGVEGGYLQGHRDFSCLVDFASNPAGTWLTLVDVVSASGNYTTVGFTLDIIDNNGNHAPSSTIDTIDRETYYVHCCRTEATTANVPDACYVRGPSNRIRAVKTAVGVYEIQIQNDSLSREYRVDIKVHGTAGTHTVNYRNGDAGSTGTAQYNASVSSGGNKEYFNSVSIDPANSTGLFIDGSGITTSAAAIAVAYDSTITGQGNNRTLFAYQGKYNYIRGNTTYLSSDLQGVGATYSSTVNASTFNATSATNGGFQGIDADTASQPSFTWSSDPNTGMWHAGTDSIGFTTGGVNRVTISNSGLQVSGTVSWDPNQLKITGPAPSIYFNQTDGASAFLGVNGTTLYVLWDSNSDGTFEGTYPFQLNASSADAYIWGNKVFNAGYHPNADVWTTPITLTIGDTGKSVNGSGAVSWSRTDIGITKTNIDALGINADLLDGTHLSAIQADYRANDYSTLLSARANDYATLLSARANDYATWTGIINYVNVKSNTASPTFTGTVAAPTFNATSTTNGGFQGIDADSATTPSFTWTSDQNTGIWHSGEGSIGFTSNGTTKANVDSVGLTMLSGVFNHHSGNSRDKIRVWNSSSYAIGMQNAVTFGSIANDYAMTFQMSDTANRGFWWGDASHTTAQGAMSLSTQGHLTVANAIRLGYGESDTVKAGTNSTLDILGNSAQPVRIASTGANSGGIDFYGNTSEYLGRLNSSYSDGSLRLLADPSNVKGSSKIEFSIDGSVRGDIDGSGNLVMDGNVTSSSDERLKKDITTIDNALYKVNNLRGVMFTMKETGQKSTGVIAQEVEKIFPEVVHGDDLKSVAYGNMVGLLIEAIKEQSQTITSLQQQIDKLTTLVTKD